VRRLTLVEELARVEGNGGITVELEGEKVSNVEFNIFEGPRAIEAIIRGRPAADIAGIVCRICAICAGVHYVTSLKATEAAFGTRVTETTDLLRDLFVRAGNIESHALHVFMLAAPDYLDYPGATAMAADHPGEVKLALRLKKLGNTLQEIVGGRAVHPVNPVLGGFGTVPRAEALIAARDELVWALDALPAALEFVAALPATEVCDAGNAYAALVMPDRYGYFHGDEIEVVREDGTRERMAGREYRNLTNEYVRAHSFAKHSAFEGQPFAVGALSRLMVNGALVNGSGQTAMKRLGLQLPSHTPLDNNLAQAIELAIDLQLALETIDNLLAGALVPQAPVVIKPRAGTGTGVTEAPRGILVHSYTYNEDGRIVAADVITPTAMNAASIERHFQFAASQHGPGTDAALTKKLEMIVRAYDPCISCSVHLVRRS
jgi:sulfhydrogenase subunit alpha